MHNNSNHTNVCAEALELEAATAVSMMSGHQDLDARIGTLRDRVGVADSRLAAFIVTMPEGYTPEDAQVFKSFISDTLVKLAEEANEQVKFERTWSKLGD